MTGGKIDPRLATMSKALGQMLQGYQALSLVGAGLDLGIFDRLASGPAHLDELTNVARIGRQSMARVLSGLEMIRMIAKSEGNFQLTALGQAASDRRLPFRDQFLLATTEYMGAWAQLGPALRAGKTPAEHALGAPIWQHRREHPEIDSAFNRVMGRVQLQTQKTLLEHGNLEGCRSLLDVGGGLGLLTAALVQHFPEMEARVFDQEHLESQAQETLSAPLLGGRATFIRGDFFQQLPGGADVLLLQHILHDWNDDECHKLLENCAAALGEGGRLLIVERVLPPREETPKAPDILRDLHMMCLTGGMERTEDEYRALLKRAGMAIQRVVITNTGADLLEATRS